MEQGTDAKIYGRTQQVQDVIVAGLSGINDCALVTDAHLAAITTLNLSGQGMTALRADDFVGLTHLRELRLSGNALTTLPTGVFSGLTTLQSLFLDHTLLTTLPAYVFSDLTALELLYLSNNDLTTLPTTVFRNLTRLQSLYLSNNTLTRDITGSCERWTPKFGQVAKVDSDLRMERSESCRNGKNTPLC